MEDPDHRFPNVCLAYPGCFGCGRIQGKRGWNTSSLDRAHLIAQSSGGTNFVNNLVLLCRECHRQAPMIGRDSKPVIDWLNRREYYISKMFRLIVAECDALNPRMAEDLKALGMSSKEFEEAIDDVGQFMKIEFHPGGDHAAGVAVMMQSMIEFMQIVKRRERRLRTATLSGP